MAKKASALNNIVQPTRAMTDEQLREQFHLARRSGADVNRFRQARKGITKGGRGNSRRAAIAAGF